MTIFFLALGLWGIFVILAPVGIWNAKERIAHLERQVADLRALLKLQNSPNPVVREQYPVEQKIIKPEIIRPDIIKPEIVMPEEVVEEAPWENKAAKTAANYQKVKLANEFSIPDWLSSALTGGKLFVTLGILLLFIGIGMLFKYVAHFMAFPIEARFVAVALCAFVMIAFGRSQVSKRRDYGLYMQGGGLGMLFLTVYTAFKFYGLLPADIAFALLVAIGASTFALSIASDSMALSVLAVTGAFSAPVLASTGHGSHIALFSYYLVINLVIFAIAWKKSWRLLNTIGFLFTFSLGSLWGINYYRPEYYGSVQIFLIAYFLLYVAIGIMYASRKDPEFSNPIDSASIFGVPLIGYGLQLSLVQEIVNGKTISTLALGIFYAVLFMAFKPSRNSGLKFLSRIFMSFSILFFTMVIQFNYGSHTTAMLWSMEGVCLLWLAGKINDRLNLYAGIAVLAFSNIFMLESFKMQGQGEIFLNSFFLSCAVMTVTHIAASYFISRQNLLARNNKDSITNIYSFTGMLWWFIPGMGEINSHYAYSSLSSSYLTFYSLSSLIFYQLFLFVRIAHTDLPVRGILAAIGLLALNGILKTGIHQYHPFMEYGWIALPLAFAVHYYWLWSARSNNSKLHGLSFLGLVSLVGLEAGYRLYIINFIDSYMVCGWLLAVIGGILLLSLPEKKQFWPTDILNKYCRMQVGNQLIYAAFAFCLYSFTLSSASPQEKYIPIFNIIDLVEFATIVSMFAFYKASTPYDSRVGPVVYMMAVLSFAFINCVMLRIISVKTGLYYFSNEMFASMLTQTSLTILWTLASMAAMVISSRYKFRRGWLMGAGLLGIVVVKLFVRDLDGSGTLERIVSFMGVGVLSLVLGYVSPMPPKLEEQR